MSGSSLFSITVPALAGTAETVANTKQFSWRLPTFQTSIYLGEHPGDVGASVSIPMHPRSFPLNRDPPQWPPEGFQDQETHSTSENSDWGKP